MRRWSRNFAVQSIWLGLSALGVALVVLPAAVLAKETRTFVVGYFGQATYSQDNDCANGINPDVTVQYLKNLRDLGYTPAQIDALSRKSNDAGGGIGEIMKERGRIDGKPVNAYTYPAAVIDPKLHALTGKYAYGFNLDGRGADAPQAFEDPETHETGVDNQLARAFGCMRPFRGSLAGRPTYWAWAWGQLKDSQPAWLISIVGEDLTKDGEVKVSFDRALHYLKSNIDGTPRADTTYRIDPDTRSHNVLRGRIKNGVIELTEHGDFRMLQNPMVVNDFRLKNTHMRLKLKPDGSLEGIVGGYQPWADIYSGFASSAPAMEVCITGDVPGLYYLLIKNADAAPDPKTGQNMAISTAYYLEAIPSFVVSPDGKIASGP